MKKLLLASTALAFSAGVASADVTLSGSAKMGLLYNSNDNLGTSGTESVDLMHTLGVTFTLSGETDGGLAFGGSFDASDAVAADNGTAGTVFISGEFGTLTFGDVSGAAETIVGDLAGVGLDGVGDGNENAFLTSSAATGALYEYDLDGLALALSVTNNNGFGTPITTHTEAYSVGAGYSFDMFAAGIGLERTTGTGVGDLNHAIAYVQADFQGVTAKATYGNVTSGVFAEDDQYGLSVSGTFDATTVTAYGRRAFSGFTNYGIGASYDLGGGASIAGGIASIGGATDTTIADFGLSFSF